ncbi:hypothetical protein SASPL_100739 [Salvia splendens]|uniref:Uncharacterized protein n=1 Tax=Salvia splendens TaxID=180675 RepID=A0A8X8YUI0_SALSN|nr:hypothetical protein SASPL_100739 [Salvia splendens]
MGNIVSSAIMVPKELIKQRMQAGAKGRSWEVLLRILEKDGILGLYAGYSATLLRNIPAGVLSYSSFEYLKAAVLKETSSQIWSRIRVEAVNKVSAAMYSGVRDTVEHILKEEGRVGFTHGMGHRVFYSACFSAIGYFAFETARLTVLNEYIRRKEREDAAVPAFAVVDQSG